MDQRPISGHWRPWGHFEVQLSSGSVTISRYKIEFWIDGQPIAATQLARNPAPLVSDIVANYVLALTAPGQKLVLAPSSDTVNADGTLTANDQRPTQQSLYLEYVVPGKDLEHAWVTWRGRNRASMGELLLSLTEADTREVIRRHFGAPGFVAFVIDSEAQVSIRELALRVNSAFVIGTPTYYLEGLTPGGLVIEEADDGCALSVCTGDVTEEDLLARLTALQ